MMLDLYADLHLHSPYSGGTSVKMTLENLNYYGKMKGLNIIGTGDITGLGVTRVLEAIRHIDPSIKLYQA